MIGSEGRTVVFDIIRACPKTVDSRAKQRAPSTHQTCSKQQFLVRNRLETKRIIAVGLLTHDDLKLLGSAFSRAWPVEDTPCFSGLLQAIDEADRQLHRDRDEEIRLTQTTVRDT